MNTQIKGDASAGYDIQGDLTYDTVPELFRRGGLEFADTTHLDLASVEHVDSAGLALLVEWSCAASRKGKCLVLTNTPASLESLIQVSGLKEVLSVSGD